MLVIQYNSTQITFSGVYKNDGDFDVYINIADVPELNVVEVY